MLAYNSKLGHSSYSKLLSLDSTNTLHIYVEFGLQSDTLLRSKNLLKDGWSPALLKHVFPNSEFAFIIILIVVVVVLLPANTASRTVI
jgi:hypothetical protein